MLTQFSVETLTQIAKVISKIDVNNCLTDDELVIFELFRSSVLNHCSASVCMSWMEPAALKNVTLDLEGIKV